MDLSSSLDPIFIRDLFSRVPQLLKEVFRRRPDPNRGNGDRSSRVANRIAHRDRDRASPFDHRYEFGLAIPIVVQDDDGLELLYDLERVPLSQESAVVGQPTASTRTHYFVYR